MHEGRIKKLLADKGCGFIQTADCPNGYFFHRNNLAHGHQFNSLREGDSVVFSLGPSRNRPGTKEALKVKPLRSAAQAQIDSASTKLPYQFVPIDPARTVTYTPVWHDGSSGGELLSGEILCDLEALTPLLPGNQRYFVKKDGKDNGDFLAKDGIRGVLAGLGGQEPKAGKQIAEPLRLPDGRVLIVGTAIKGMIRQSLGALTSAPMERVAEHHFTYRPNFGHADSPGYVCRPAVVDRQDGEEWIVNVLPGARDAFFRADQKPADAVEFIYRGGIDGKGILAASAPRQTYVYKKAWISSAKLKKAEECRISKSVFDAYLKTQCILSSDHINTSHPQSFDREKVKRAIKDATKIEAGQLIYVEKKVGSDEIVSLGHHYQYRWAYTSSVRYKGGTPRLCLTPHKEETAPSSKAAGPDSPPNQLTGARLLFGYVRNDENPIGKGVFERLAGRIAINHAVSVEKDPEKLFVGSEAQKYCIPLKILGQPKASAWEFYLKQDKNKPLATYGDLPGVAGGDLSGRKFYRHWKSVSESHIRATTEEVLSDQAAVARYICKPGTKFRFAIRFARLRDWELGALLAVLQPQLLAKEGESTEYAHKLGLGRPLGMGSVSIRRTDIRVRCERDAGFLDEPAKNEVIDWALQSVRNRVAGPSLEKWLSALAVGDKALKYPVDQTRENGQFVDRIYAWHTEVRRQYSKLRRERADRAEWAGLHAKIGKELPD